MFLPIFVTIHVASAFTCVEFFLMFLLADMLLVFFFVSTNKYAYGITQMVECSVTSICKLSYSNNIQS